MKCINRFRISIIAIALISLMLFSGCSDKKFTKEYDITNENYAFSLTNISELNTVKAFAQDLCIASSDKTSDDVNDALFESGALFDVTSHETIYSSNAHERLYPASLTKVLTALIAIEKGDYDDVITVSKNAEIKESGAQLCGFKEGDKITLDQALHGLMMHSGNDAGVAIAEYISGSIEDFAELMNERANSLGATNSNFVNPHGLSDENHYTTAYDLYLIFNEAMKNEKFVELINMETWTTTYTLSDGSDKEITFNTTNRYLKGDEKSPEGITVVGGKTGTTNAAGACLILLSKDASDNQYISVILKAESGSVLYSEMSDILGEINK